MTETFAFDIIEKVESDNFATFTHFFSPNRL